MSMACMMTSERLKSCAMRSMTDRLSALPKRLSESTFQISPCDAASFSSCNSRASVSAYC